MPRSHLGPSALDLRGKVKGQGGKKEEDQGNGEVPAPSALLRRIGVAGHRLSSSAWSGARGMNQVVRTFLYFWTSSRILPAPLTTQVRGSSSTWIGKIRLVLEKAVQASDHGPPSRHDDASIHDVGGQLRRSDLQGPANGLHDGLDGLLDALPDLLGVDGHGFRDTAHQVPPLHLHLPFLTKIEGRSDLDLDGLRRGLADEEVVILSAGR